MTLSRLLITAILIWLCSQGLHGQTIDQARAYLTQWEGRTTSVVTRANGERVVGIGHNTAFDRSVKSVYSDREIEALFNHDYVIAMGAARRGVRDFDGLPLDVRLVVVGLVWCCGPTGFQRFVELRRCLSSRFYEGAAVELVDSKWWHDVSARRANAALKTLRAQIRP